MNAWKLVVYPFGLAFLSLLLVNLTGIAIFGPDARLWFEWQNRILSAVGAVGVIGGFVSGVYLATKDNARFIP